MKRLGLTANMAAVMVIGAIVATGAVAGGLLWLSGGFGQQSATETPGEIVVDKSGQPVTETKSATLTINAFDQGGSSASEVTNANASVWKASSSDAYGTRLKSSGSFEIGGVTVSSGLSNKDAYTIVETDAAYYTDDTGRADGEDVAQPPRSVEIKGSTEPTYQYNLVTVADESDLSLSAYDDRGNELTAGTSNQEDYEVSLSADEDKTLEFELKQTGTDKYYDVCGAAVKTLNDVDDVAEVSFTDPDGNSIGYNDGRAPAEHLETDIAMNESNGLSENVTDYDEVFRFDSEVRLAKNDKLVMNFDIQADSDNDPTAVDSGDLTTTDALIVQFKDCDWYETPGLGADYGYHDESSSEADVGLDESDYSPLGAETGLILEAK